VCVCVCARVHLVYLCVSFQLGGETNCFEENNNDSVLPFNHFRLIYFMYYGPRVRVGPFSRLSDHDVITSVRQHIYTSIYFEGGISQGERFVCI